MQKIKGIPLIVWVVSATMFVAVMTGLFLAGSPMQERARRLDSQRVSDLQQISNSVDQAFNMPGAKLPTSLEDLRARRDVYLSSTVDPDTSLPYTYKPTAANGYELCATFQTDTTGPVDKNQTTYPERQGSDFWKHPVGMKCFAITAQNYNTVKPVPTM